MKNYFQDGTTITTEAPSGGVDSGDAILLGAVATGIVVIALSDAAAEADVEARSGGVVELPKASATEIDQGAIVTIATATGLVVTNAAGTGFHRCGVAWTEGVDGETTVMVKLHAT